MNESQKQMCAKLWEIYEPQLRRICNLKLMGVQEEKEEVLSDAFLVLCKKIDAEGEIKYPRAWLYATVNNLIKQKYTERTRFNENFVSDYKQVNLAYEHNLTGEVFDEEMLEKLKVILKQELTDDEKQLLYYVIFDKKSYKEIAELAATNENVIKQRKYRLFNKIKKLAKENK